MASLLAELTQSGSRKSDGTANATGTVFAYLPGTTTPATLYTDRDLTAIAIQPIVLDNGGRINRSTYPDGLWITQQVRLLVQDSSGAIVSDGTYTPSEAGNTFVDNAGFTGATMDAVLTSALTSFGGQDFKYLIANGQTPLKVKDAITEISISVSAFGAVGDGTAIDTTAIQAALNFAKAAGGGVVLFPPGTYKIDQAETLTSATGVTLKGAGQLTSKIVTTHASANIFTFTSCTSLTIEGLGLSASATNSGSAISLTSCSGVTLNGVLVDTTGGGTFLIPVVSSGTGVLILEECRLTAKAADASARALKMTNGSGVNVRGGFFSGLAGAAMEFAGSTSFVNVFSAGFGSSGTNIGLLWTSGMTGTDFVIVGCQTLRTGVGLITTPFDLSALTTDPRLRQWGNENDGTQVDVASGGTATPPRIGPYYTVRVRATSTGAASTIAAPTPAPPASMRGVFLVLEVYNNAGGAITGWTMNAVYHLSAGPSTTDTEITSYLLNWDGSVWRQISRSVTT